MEEKKLTDDETFIWLLEGSKWKAYNLQEIPDLIRRLQSENVKQKAEIERLTLAVEGLKGENKVIHKENDELLGKIERLTKENSNVISMNDALYREKAELQKQVDELENRFENKACCNMSENCSMVQQSVKYTAREILTELKNTRFHKGTLTYDFEMALNKIAEKYSIEVE